MNETSAELKALSKMGVKVSSWLAVARRRAAATGGQGWYSIKNVSASEAEVLIYDYIGHGGVAASDFVRELADIRATKITLRINSPGGDVFDGIAIYNAIKRHQAEVSVFVDGVAASAASFIAMAGDTITMMPHSQMMIHEAEGIVIGPADDMRKFADFLDKSSDNIASIFAERTGTTTKEWRTRMRDESWFSDQEAVNLGLADGIGDEKVAARLGGVNWARLFEDIADEAEEAQIAAKEPPDFLRVFEKIADEAEEQQHAISEPPAFLRRRR